MSGDTELTAFLLRYLHDNHYFQTMEDMAEALDISKRHIQRLINDADSLKGGSIALSKILQYFGRHHIPFDPVLIEFVSNTVRRDEIERIQLEKPYMRLNLPLSECIISSKCKLNRNSGVFKMILLYLQRWFSFGLA